MFQFTQNNSHRHYLFKTHPTTLVYCSPTSTFWGIGLPKEKTESLDPTEWKGANKLGYLLGKVRDEMMFDPNPTFLANPTVPNLRVAVAEGEKRVVTTVEPPPVQWDAVYDRP